MRRLKVGVVGAGIFGQIHARSYYGYHRSEIVAICDLKEEKAREVSQKLGCSYTTNSKDIAQEEEIEAVSIVTPDFAHKEVALEMIDAGKHVLIEKPLTTNSKEAEEIIQAAKGKKVKLMVDFHNRWNPPFLEAKGRIDKGELGKPIMAYCRLSNRIDVPTEWLSWSGKSGPEWFLYPHLIDIVRWLFNQEVKEVYAQGRREVLKSKGIDAYDSIQTLARLEDSFATFETSWILPLSQPNIVDFQISLFGTKGRIDIDLTHQSIDIACVKHELPLIAGETQVHGKVLGFFPLPIHHFVDCVLDEMEPLATGMDGLVVTRVIEAIVESMEKGKIIGLT